MHINKLKLIGFKSFVEPSELIIEPGLTGVVGPNGCGKSNLLEALRWVMGETSYKAMRGGAMEDVIFSGTSLRPKRNVAEVILTIDNKKRTAPAEFNDSDELIITRRIERDQGSSYSINGAHARAKDIKLLFEDAATGSRSHALVRQGQIGEIVGSKPQARRRILEDAAGIAGLHSRRHESELRLRQAETNLERVSDVIGQLDSQLNSLKRQARHAERYKLLSKEIKSLNALVHFCKWQRAGEQVTASEAKYNEILSFVSKVTEQETAGTVKLNECAEKIEPLRLEEQKHAIIISRLTIEQEHLNKEQQQLKSRAENLAQKLIEAEADQTREQERIKTAEAMITRLKGEQQEILTGQKNHQLRLEAAKNERLELAQKLTDIESQYEQAQTQLSTQRAARQSVLSQLSEQTSRRTRLEDQLAAVKAQQADLSSDNGLFDEMNKLEQSIARLESQLKEDETNFQTISQQLDAHNNKERALQDQAKQAELNVTHLKTEINTLNKLLSPGDDHHWPVILDELKAETGYELALAASLGDDLEASTDTSAPLHWRNINNMPLSPLPGDLTSLADVVDGPKVLHNRLTMTGIVSSKEDGLKFQPDLKPGQRLVSKDGSLWRWDGFYAAGDASTPAARRLEEKNRLSQLSEDFAKAEQQLAPLAKALADLGEDKQNLTASHQDLQNKIRQQRTVLEQASRDLRTKQQSSLSARENKAKLTESHNLLSTQLADLLSAITNLEETQSGFASLTALEAGHEQLKTKFNTIRGEHSEALLNYQSLERQAQERAARAEKIEGELTHWTDQISHSNDHIEKLAGRAEKLKQEQEATDFSPKGLEQKRQKILNASEEAESLRKQAADQLASAENERHEADKILRQLQKELAGAREELARVETRLEGARNQLIDCASAISEQFDGATPEQCLGFANLENSEELPPLGETEQALTKAKTERDRLGSVNLLAEQEIKDLSSQFGSLIEEKEDLEKAINKLRHAIGQLNGEGRRRLMEAFDKVNKHFKYLFTTLFNGGEAELQLVESDDPLEAGLEILARPPGKKPQVLTLLSGGEKALTAMAMIFAVFLTNPSPICVLDEVDAPLDDANVDRFCTLLEDMRKNTDTRFLVITHHPMTMARMNRLFGVTMQEKGVSQLVSVDLSTAENLREAS